MAKQSDTTTRKIVLKRQNSHKERLKTIYSWIKQSVINTVEFEELLAYLEVVDDIKDAEFTKKRLDELRAAG